MTALHQHRALGLKWNSGICMDKRFVSPCCLWDREAAPGSQSGRILCPFLYCRNMKKACITEQEIKEDTDESRNALNSSLTFSSFHLSTTRRISVIFYSDKFNSIQTSVLQRSRSIETNILVKSKRPLSQSAADNKSELGKTKPLVSGQLLPPFHLLATKKEWKIL